MEYMEYLQTELLSNPLNIILAIAAGYLLWQLLKPPPPPPRSCAPSRARAGSTWSLVRSLCSGGATSTATLSFRQPRRL